MAKKRRRRSSSAAVATAVAASPNPSPPAILPTPDPTPTPTPTPIPIPIPSFEDPPDVIRTISLGEIWAFALESDGCPRSYARVDRIHPLPLPSFLHVTPLVLHPTTDREILCSENALPIPCGLFSLSPSPVLKPLLAFSHRVPTRPDPARSGLFRIFPNKGEVWAVYDRYVDATVGFEYRLVEAVSDFDDKNGVDVAALVATSVSEEAEGTVYRRQVVQERFERELLFVFSHRVVASRVVRDGKNFWKVNLD